MHKYNLELTTAHRSALELEPRQNSHKVSGLPPHSADRCRLPGVRRQRGTDIVRIDRLKVLSAQTVGFTHHLKQLERDEMSTVEAHFVPNVAFETARKCLKAASQAERQTPNSALSKRSSGKLCLRQPSCKKQKQPFNSFFGR